MDQQVEEVDSGLNAVVPYTDLYLELHAPRADSYACTGNQNKSLSSFDHYTIKILRHDVEHCSIINLLKILEDSQCPDYMLQSILEWAYNAKVNGFAFNPKATTRKANIAWMYQALEKSHQLLPHVVSTELEDHNDVAHVVCIDFTLFSIVIASK
jgi:hypothetical protein